MFVIVQNSDAFRTSKLSKNTESPDLRFPLASTLKRVKFDQHIRVLLSKICRVLNKITSIQSEAEILPYR